jgi:hypothetical protein
LTNYVWLSEHFVENVNECVVFTERANEWTALQGQKQIKGSTRMASASRQRLSLHLAVEVGVNTAKWKKERHSWDNKEMGQTLSITIFPDR